MVEVTAAKELRYGGRTILPGEKFEATVRDANLLQRIGKVAAENAADAPKKTAKRAEPVSEPDPNDEVAALRAEYTERFGKRPFMGWSPEQLRERMGETAPNEARQAEGLSDVPKYNRRDMRAED